MCHKYFNIADRALCNNQIMLAAYLMTRGIEKLLGSPSLPHPRDPAPPSPLSIEKTTGLSLVTRNNTPLGAPQHHDNTHIPAITHNQDNPNYPAHTLITLKGPMYKPHTPTHAHPSPYRNLSNVAPR